MLTVMVILSVLPIFPVFAEIDASIFEAGTGTKNDPYQIKTLCQLEKFSESVNNDDDYSKVYVKLTANIDMSDTYGSGKSSWVPIGRSNSFDGTFDGGGHKLTNLYVDGGNASDNEGLFGFIGESAVIKNLSVSGTVTGNTNVAGVVGYNNGTVIGCYSDVAVTGIAASTGGVVGLNLGTITSCGNSGAVSGVSSIGSVAGNSDYGKISQSYNTGTVTGNDNVGGLLQHRFCKRRYLCCRHSWKSYGRNDCKLL